MPNLTIMNIDPPPSDEWLTIQMTVQNAGEGNALVGNAPVIPGYDLVAITDDRGYTWTMNGQQFYLTNAPAGDIVITATYQREDPN